MAVPTFTSITPSTGHAGGVFVVEISGTGFQTYAAPAATGVVPVKASPPVEVLFGTKAATDMAVASSTRLLCVAPRGTPGIVDVTIRNVDEDTGDVIAGETVTEVDGFTYARPGLRANETNKRESSLSRLVRQVIRELKAQIIENVSPGQHTDWTDEPAVIRLVDTAELPSLTIAGPKLPRDTFRSSNVRPTSTAGLPSNEVSKRQAPRVVSLEFDLQGASDNQGELLNMAAALQVFFEKNHEVTIDRDPDDAGAGTVSYPLEEVGQVDMVSPPNTSNVHAFTAGLRVVGFEIEGLEEFQGDMTIERTATVDTVSVTAAGI